MSVEETREAAVPSGSGDSGTPRRGFPSAHERGVAGVDDGGALEELDDAADGGTLGDAR